MWYGEEKKPSVQENLSFLAPRVKPRIVDILKAKDMASLGFVPESMDIIIEDGPHTLDSQQDFLVKLFPLVKPGGYYIIEDVGYVQGAVMAFREDPSKLRNDTRAILENQFLLCGYSKERNAIASIRYSLQKECDGSWINCG